MRECIRTETAQIPTATTDWILKYKVEIANWHNVQVKALTSEGLEEAGWTRDSMWICYPGGNLLLNHGMSPSLNFIYLRAFWWFFRLAVKSWDSSHSKLSYSRVTFRDIQTTLTAKSGWLFIATINYVQQQLICWNMYSSYSRLLSLILIFFYQLFMLMTLLQIYVHCSHVSCCELELWEPK